MRPSLLTSSLTIRIRVPWMPMRVLALLICLSLPGGAMERAFGGALFPGAQFDVGGNPFSVAIGDVSGDGKPDLVTANSFSNTVSILLGHGDWTFGAKVVNAAGARP